MGEIGLGETSFTIMHRASPNLPAPRLRGLADHTAGRFAHYTFPAPDDEAASRQVAGRNALAAALPARALHRSW
jgi:hypothetical protein